MAGVVVTTGFSFMMLFPQEVFFMSESFEVLFLLVSIILNISGIVFECVRLKLGVYKAKLGTCKSLRLLKQIEINKAGETRNEIHVNETCKMNS